MNDQSAESSRIDPRLNVMMFLEYAVKGLWFPLASVFLSAAVANGGLGFSDAQKGSIIGLGAAIGASIGFVLAAVITQFPPVEKIVAPYILLLVTTPMLALVPLLILRFGFGLEPRIIAVALASGPMVMINSATGFRRVDLAKIALARSFGASTLQIFLKIRIPMALPMVIVGLMIGTAMGLSTVVTIALAVGLAFLFGYSLSTLPLIQAGLGFDATLARVGEELQAAHPYLAEEFLLVILELRAGKPRDRVLQDLALRTGVEEINSFQTVMNQSIRYGTSISDALEVYAQEMRHKRMMRAEELASQLPVKMSVAMVAFMPSLLYFAPQPPPINPPR